MKGRIRNAILAISFIFFMLIISEVSESLIEIVPAPQIAWLDLYTIVHAVAVGGTAIFILVSTQDNVKLRKNAFFTLLALIFIWEVIENTVLRETPLAGQESHGNIGFDILAGMIATGIVLSAQRGLFSSMLEKEKII